MKYPPQFSREARGKVVGAELEANKTYTTSMAGSQPLSTAQGRLAFIHANSNWIATIFGPYSHELCELGRREIWQADQVKEEAELTVLILAKKVRDRCEEFRRRFPEIPNLWTEELVQETLGMLQHTEQWRQYESEAMAVAKQQSQPNPIPSPASRWTHALAPPITPLSGRGGYPAFTESIYPKQAEPDALMPSPKPTKRRRLSKTIKSEAAAARLEKFLDASPIEKTVFAREAGTTERTLLRFRRTARINRKTLADIATAMNTTLEELTKPD